MGKGIKIWYDSEGVYLEVLFEQKAGYFKEAENDAVMERVDAEKPLSFSLKSHVAQRQKYPKSEAK